MKATKFLGIINSTLQKQKKKKKQRGKAKKRGNENKKWNNFKLARKAKTAKRKLRDQHQQYLNSILKRMQGNYLKQICENNPLQHQKEINYKMRVILFDWIHQVSQKFKLKLRTIFLTIKIFDYYIRDKQIPRNELQLVGVTCFLIAAKFEDIYPPEVFEIVFLCDNIYTSKQVLKMESRILKCLNFSLVMITPVDIAELLLDVLEISSAQTLRRVQAVLQVFLFHEWVDQFDIFYLAYFSICIADQANFGNEMEDQVMQIFKLEMARLLYLLKIENTKFFKFLMEMNGGAISDFFYSSLN